MTPDITGLAGLFGRNFVIGYLVPAVLFVAVCMIGIVEPIGFLQGLGSEPSWSLLFLLFLCCAFLALWLYLFNYQLTRLYEGYEPWSWRQVLRPALWLQQKRFNQLKEKMDRLESYDKYALLIRFVERFPSSEHELTATRLGNIIRAFETYAYNRYGMDAVILWPRLLAVLPNKQTASISEAVANFNFFLNVSFLSVLLAPWYFLVFDPRGFKRCSVVVAPLVASYIFYRGACSAASWWGQLVKATFDVYRFDLLKHMRVGVPPDLTLEQERELWPQIQMSMKYLRDPVPPLMSNLRK